MANCCEQGRDQWRAVVNRIMNLRDQWRTVVNRVMHLKDQRRAVVNRVGISGGLL